MSGFLVPDWLWGYVDHRRRLFHPGARCSTCRVADPVVLVFRSRPLVCRRCRLQRRTGRLTELHHVGGRPSPLVVEVDANVHVWLSLCQYGWRGRFAAGAPPAVLCDVLVLFAVRLQKVSGGEAA